MFKIGKISACPIEPLRNDRGTTIQLVGEGIGAQKVDVHIIVLRPGGPSGPYHYHEHAENVYWVLEGKGRLIVEGEERIVEKDDIIFISPGTRHSLTSFPEEELRLLEIYAPAGKDFVPVG
jgi:mannose-6-phosphate isomerase-like protein (cupin superfamily)